MFTNSLHCIGVIFPSTVATEVCDSFEKSKKKHGKWKHLFGVGNVGGCRMFNV